MINRIEIIVKFTSSSISFVCDAERQKRTRPRINGVAGKPTVTTATPRFNISRLNALEKNKLAIEIPVNSSYAIFDGLYSNAGTTGECG